jgi:hypothetical protein
MNYLKQKRKAFGVYVDQCSSPVLESNVMKISISKLFFDIFPVQTSLPQKGNEISSSLVLSLHYHYATEISSMDGRGDDTQSYQLSACFCIPL